MMKKMHAYISGKVQGVWYRASTQNKAQQLGVTGWVRNCLDGRVELTAEGDEAQLLQLLDWCKQGPEQAKVNDIEVVWSEATSQFEQFCVAETQ